MELSIKNLQDYLYFLYKDKASSERIFMKMVEEMGEIAETLNVKNSYKKEKTNSISLEEEIADLLHYLIALASINDIDLTKVIINKDKIGALKYNHENILEFLERSR